MWAQCLVYNWRRQWTRSVCLTAIINHVGKAGLRYKQKKWNMPDKCRYVKFIDKGLVGTVEGAVTEVATPIIKRRRLSLERIKLHRFNNRANNMVIKCLRSRTKRISKGRTADNGKSNRRTIGQWDVETRLNVSSPPFPTLTLYVLHLTSFFQGIKKLFPLSHPSLLDPLPNFHFVNPFYIF